MFYFSSILSGSNCYVLKHWHCLCETQVFIEGSITSISITEKLIIAPALKLSHFSAGVPTIVVLTTICTNVLVNGDMISSMREDV